MFESVNENVEEIRISRTVCFNLTLRLITLLAVDIETEPQVIASISDTTTTAWLFVVRTSKLYGLEVNDIPKSYLIFDYIYIQKVDKNI